MKDSTKKKIEKSIEGKSVIPAVIKNVFIAALSILIIFLVLEVINLNNEKKELNNRVAPDSIFKEYKMKKNSADTLISAKDSNTYILIHK